MMRRAVTRRRPRNSSEPCAEEPAAPPPLLCAARRVGAAGPIRLAHYRCFGDGSELESRTARRAAAAGGAVFRAARRDENPMTLRALTERHTDRFSAGCAISCLRAYG